MWNTLISFCLWFSDGSITMTGKVDSKYNFNLLFIFKASLVHLCYLYILIRIQSQDLNFPPLTPAFVNSKSHLSAFFYWLSHWCSKRLRQQHCSFASSYFYTPTKKHLTWFLTTSITQPSLQYRNSFHIQSFSSCHEE